MKLSPEQIEYIAEEVLGAPFLNMVATQKDALDQLMRKRENTIINDSYNKAMTDSKGKRWWDVRARDIIWKLWRERKQSREYDRISRYEYKRLMDDFIQLRSEYVKTISELNAIRKTKGDYGTV